MDDRIDRVEDLVGPGTGGSPTDAGMRPDEAERDEDAAVRDDPDVAAMVENLRSDAGDERELERSVEVDVEEAAEQTGTGTDR